VRFQLLLPICCPIRGRLIQRCHREYTLRFADAGRGDRYLVAVVGQIEQGTGEAQDAARDLLDDLDPSLLLVVRIAGGLPSDDVTLGDVVLSITIRAARTAGDILKHVDPNRSIETRFRFFT
jgi:nucleoside phosphorylase